MGLFAGLSVPMSAAFVIGRALPYLAHGGGPRAFLLGTGVALTLVFVALSLLNPVDLARIFLLLEFDISALMGFTGALFRDFFGSAGGRLAAIAALLAWLAVPFWGCGVSVGRTSEARWECGALPGRRTSGTEPAPIYSGHDGEMTSFS